MSSRKPKKEIKAVFESKSFQNRHGKKQNFETFSDFHYFCSIFVEISIDFVDESVKTSKVWANLLFR